MNKDFAECIKRMVKSHGKEILLNGNAKNLMADYCGSQFKKESFIFQRMLEAGCGKLINEADNVPEVERLLVARMEESEGLSPKSTVWLIDLLGLILRGDTGITKTPQEMEEEARAKAIAEAKARADAEAAARERAEVKAKAEADARRKAEAEAANAKAQYKPQQSSSQSSPGTQTNVQQFGWFGWYSDEILIAAFISTGICIAAGIVIGIYRVILLALVCLVALLIIKKVKDDLSLTAEGVAPFICMVVVIAGSLFFIFTAPSSRSSLPAVSPGNETVNVTETVTVISDALNLRASSTGTSEVITTLRKGDVLTVRGNAHDGWLPVAHNGIEGWVSGEYVEKGD
jgi:hypothetical protein